MEDFHGAGFDPADVVGHPATVTSTLGDGGLSQPAEGLRQSGGRAGKGPATGHDEGEVMGMELAEFLLARIAMDEWAARNVWERPHLGSCNTQGDLGSRRDECDCGFPARVLAECEAKRRIVELHRPPIRDPETNGELHARSAHPAWEYATTEGPRKQWDDADVPPDGDGWERNVDAGRDGWERFDYTEESYWRRPRPTGPRPALEPLTLRLLALPYADHPDYQQEWRP